MFNYMCSMCSKSLVDNKVQIHGNIDLANTLKNLIKEKCIGCVDLYKAQDIIRDYCVDNYGMNFYKNNAEAINFLIENEYCNLERSKLPFFDIDAETYKENMKKGVMY